MHSFTLTETFQKRFIDAYPIWVYMPLGTSTLPWSPTEYSMDSYSILRQINFQGLRCVTYTTWLRELLISQIWHFLD